MRSRASSFSLFLLFLLLLLLWLLPLPLRNRQYYLGRYDTEGEAHTVVQRATKEVMVRPSQIIALFLCTKYRLEPRSTRHVCRAGPGILL